MTHVYTPLPVPPLPDPKTLNLEKDKGETRNGKACLQTLSFAEKKKKKFDVGKGFSTGLAAEAGSHMRSGQQHCGEGYR